MRHYPGSVVLGEYFRLINGNAICDEVTVTDTLSN